ncbi:hypothetical protein ATCC90586_001900 [Pythium insidiosum]|nr:hypothetical protein ATCC90586_001900 [Pythium insidiosum]
MLRDQEEHGKLGEPLLEPSPPPHSNTRPTTVPGLAMSDPNSNFTSFSNLPRAEQREGNVAAMWNRVRRWDASTLIRYLRYINVLLAILQALAGFLGLFDLVTLDITSFLISVYAIIFALLLLAFECRFSSMEPKIREQFGFLFTYRGRTAFIFCVGFMDFGMDNTLGWLVGILMCSNAFFNMLVMMCHPEFRNGNLSGSMDPTATYTGAGEETAQLLSAHPDVAAKAGAFVADQAKQNPQFAVQVAQAYVAAPANPSAANAGTYVPPAPTLAGK